MRRRIVAWQKKFGEIDPWGQFHQRVYAQLLRAQIPKAQKRQSTQTKLVLNLLTVLYFNLDHNQYDLN